MCILSKALTEYGVSKYKFPEIFNMANMLDYLIDEFNITTRTSRMIGIFQSLIKWQDKNGTGISYVKYDIPVFNNLEFISRLYYETSTCEKFPEAARLFNDLKQAFEESMTMLSDRGVGLTRSDVNDMFRTIDNKTLEAELAMLCGVNNYSDVVKEFMKYLNIGKMRYLIKFSNPLAISNVKKMILNQIK